MSSAPHRNFISDAPAPNRDTARTAPLRLIIAYKFARGAAACALGFALLGFEFAGQGAKLQGVARALHHHVTGGLTFHLAELATRAVEPRHVVAIATALLLDGAFAFFEGWALRRDVWWGPWLVVVATGMLIPFEVIALAHRFTVTRVALLVINLAIVLYLFGRARREGAQRVLSETKNERGP